MILILDLDLDVLKMYLHTKHRFSKSRLSEIRVQTGHTNRQTKTDATERITTPHSQLVQPFH